jgi:hypothetical protein
MLPGRLAFLLLPLVLVLMSSRADACSCVAGLPICQTFWQADAVFAGEVLSIDPVPDGADPGFSRKRVRFKVQEVWRGGIEEIPAGTYAIALGTSGTEQAYGPREVTLADPRACVVADFSVAPYGRLAASRLRR